jgi:hypothetical protein
LWIEDCRLIPQASQTTTSQGLRESWRSSASSIQSSILNRQSSIVNR